MADSPSLPPTKPKPGSLRDRIAAFEKPTAGASSTPKPPPTKPKSGNINWKPTPVPPPENAPSENAEHEERKHRSGMSASDAKESIGMGGSLKERMAALKGKGAFGGIVPGPPPPPGPKPVKRPPLVVSPPPMDESDESTKAPETSTDQPKDEQVEAEEKDVPSSEAKVEPKKEESPEEEQDEETNERERRAAIAARLARLGGARVGMAPPVIPRKPETKSKPTTISSESKELDEGIAAGDVSLTAEVNVIESLPEDATNERTGLDAIILSPMVATPPGMKETGSDTGHVTGDTFQSRAVPLPPLFAYSPSSEPETQSDEQPVPQNEATTPQRCLLSPSHSSPPSIPLPAVPRRATLPRNNASCIKSNAKSQEADVQAAIVAPVEPEEPDQEKGVETTHVEPSSKFEDQPKEGNNVLEKQIKEAQDASEREHIVLPTEGESVLKGDDILPYQDPAAHAQLLAKVDLNVPDRPPIPEPVIQTDVSDPEADISETEVYNPAFDSEPEVYSPEPDVHTSEPEPAAAANGNVTEDESPHVDIHVRPASSEYEDSYLDTADKEAEPAIIPLAVHESEREIESTHEVTTEDHEDLKQDAQDEEDEEEDIGRKKRIAERMAKMGGRNPLNASPFFAIPSKKASRSISAEQHTATTFAPESQTGDRYAQSHEADVHDTRVDNEAEQDEEAESAIKDLHEVAGDNNFRQEQAQEHDYITPLTSHTVIHAGRLQKIPAFVESVPSGQNDIGSSEEVAEMAPPRITRAVPPPPPPLPPAPLVEGDVAHEGPKPRLPPQRRSMRPPPLPAESVVHEEREDAVEEEEGENEEAEEDGEEENERTEVDIENEEKEEKVQAETEQVQAPVQEYKERSASPPLALPPLRKLSSMPQQEEFPTPIYTKRLSSPPRVIPTPPSQQSTSPRAIPPPPSSPPHRAVSPPAPARRPPVPQGMRPTSPEVPVSPSSPPARRSMPPPPPPFVAPPPPIEDRPAPPPRRNYPQPSENISRPPVSSQVLSEGRDPLTAEIKTKMIIEDQEVLHESEPDPIDPGFHSPPRSPLSARDQVHFTPKIPSGEVSEDQTEDDNEQSRRQTIAERMAKLGGLHFGAPPSIRKAAPPPPPAEGETGDEDESPRAVEDESYNDSAPTPPLAEAYSDEAERARRRAIANRLAGMGGMRFGMFPPPVTPSHPRNASGDTLHNYIAEAEAPVQQHVSQAHPATEEDMESVSDEGVKVEAASETSIEEVNSEDAIEEPEEIPPPPPMRSGGIRSSRMLSSDVTPPTPPSRANRPPIPTAIPPKRPSISKVESHESSTYEPARKSSGSTMHPMPSDFVMVDEEEAAPPPPPSRPRPTPRSTAPTPPSKDIDNSPWELPEIPSGSFSMNVGGGLGLAASFSSEDSTTYPPPTATPLPPPEPVTRIPSSFAPVRSEAPLSGEELMQLWSTVGTNVHAAATALFDRSKKNVVGDGTNQGFVNAVLAQVPQASKVSHGHLVYAQSGNTVSRRSSNIMPGDIVELIDAKLKGHKGLQSYHQSAGTIHEPLVGIVSEFDGKKSKIKVLQANQHVGSQTVEMVSYRLDDLKSGNAKIFRVAPA